MRSVTGLIRKLYRDTIRFVFQFGVIGVLAYLVDVAIFNILRVGWLGAGWQSTVLGATILSMTVSTVFAWVGNRYWTFRSHRRQNMVRELMEFSLVALIGFFITLACLYVSHYVLGLRSLLADNISKNVIGFVVATAFRFLAYRYWVYGDRRSDRIVTE